MIQRPAIENAFATPNRNPNLVGNTTRNKIPLFAKLAYTAFMAVLIPVYLHFYGPTNFLYFCDVALLLTLAGVWTENSLLISMPAVGILLAQGLWLADFGGNLVGLHLTGMTNYMFNSHRPLYLRGLSLFHGWLPIFLVWLLSRVGYDRRALPAWSVVALVLVLISYILLPPAGAHLANANLPVNVNYVYGFSDETPQHWMNQNLYVGVWMSALTLLAYVPTHLILKKVFAGKPVVMDRA